MRQVIFIFFVLINSCTLSKQIDLSQKALIQNNYDLQLEKFHVRRMVGNPNFLDAWSRATDSSSKLLVLEYLLSTLFEAIDFGARKSQIYNLVCELKDFITDHQDEITVHDRIWFEIQLENFCYMRWGTADYL